MLKRLSLFTNLELRRIAVFTCVAISASTNISAQSPATRFPLSSAQVVTAMEGLQLPTQGVEIKIVATITASVQSPAIIIQSMSLLGEHSARFRVVCLNHGECLPFYATAVWPEQSAAITVPIELSSPANSPKNKPVTGRTATTGSASRAEAPSKSTVKEPPVLRAGMSSTMVIEAERIHIRLQVVSLQNGATGDKVRVATADRKQSYTAEIVSPTLLKGIL